ncbi:hypothetical protein DL96DRAFT_690841 [Flagelloscypha sp. PMI_526]|nr:hypothetical protein DL96DRAFT_690841 [Flagelloscypha sp. PMI_526]
MPASFTTTTSSPSPSPPETLEAIQPLFFPDGNLILRSQNKLFKIYRGILTSQSPVFRDLLSVPHTGSRMDGCPVVVLQDDPAEVEIFLRSLFEGSYFEPVPYRTSVKILTGVLRLAHKYDVQHLRQRALRHLATAFPTSLSSLTLREADEWTFEMTTEDRVSLTTLAHDVDALWALPIGLHKLTFQLPFNDLFDSAQLGLTESQRRGCLKALDNYSHSCFEMTRFLMQDEDPGSPNSWQADCEHVEQCSIARYTWLSTLQKLIASTAVEEGAGRISPFYLWGDHFWDAYSTKVCSRCVARDRELHRRASDRLWDLLPGNFGLPSWVRLKQLKIEDLGGNV